MIGTSNIIHPGNKTLMAIYYPLMLPERHNGIAAHPRMGVNIAAVSLLVVGSPPI